MGGSNQSLFLIAALFVGQGSIPGQGSAAILLLIAGLLLSWAAAPGWTELVLLYPDRVGGIAATCAEAFRPYSAVLANLTGVCYWWGWVPTCGLTAILASSALHQWYLPGVPVPWMASLLVALFTLVNLWGIRWVGRMAVPIASVSALMAFLSGLLPVLSGQVDWKQATDLSLHVPFAGRFGELTSLMAGLYLVGFAAPAFEAAACHVGETVNPARNVPRAMFASGALAGLYFVLLPLVWLGALGPAALGEDLALVLGPTFAPLAGSAAKAAAVWFMVLSMLSGTLQPLAGAARTLSQLADDGLLPRVFSQRSRTDVPWIATLLTAGMSIVFLWIGDPIWLIAAANFTYLIGIALPSLAVWLLRRDAPHLPRPYRASPLMLRLGVVAAAVWGLSALLGFEQFGLPTVVVGLAFAYSGSALYAWRVWSDRRRAGLPGMMIGLQLKLTTAMILVLGLDGVGYLLAVRHLPPQDAPLQAALSDIFVAVAILSITVALVLPGMIGHAAREVSDAARRLATGTLAEFSRAMRALADGDLDAAQARFEHVPLKVYARDEVGELAHSFLTLQSEVGRAATGLAGAREGLHRLRTELTGTNADLARRLGELHQAEEKLSGILESIDNMVWSITPDSWETVYVNTAVERIYGRPAAHFLADRNLWLRAVHPEDRDAVDRWLSETGHGEMTLLHYRVMQPDGGVRWLEGRARKVLSADGSPLRIDGVASDVSERKRHEAEMEHLARHDALTGLPNRILFNERVNHALSGARRFGLRLAILFVDLDGFKFINDSLGHSQGDALLRQMADRLRSTLRKDDTVARLGGDEFVLLLPNIGNDEVVQSVADKVLQVLSQPLAPDGHRLQVTGSIGVAVFPDDGDNAETLLKHADIAMYRAKERGRNAVQRFTRELSVQALERVRLEAAIRRAIEAEEFRLHYQPQVDLVSGRVCGVEAVLRWTDPELGTVSPARFIPLAEETGLIVPLGAWVLRTACRQAKLWNDLGLGPLPVSVNVSARQFLRQDLCQLIRIELDSSGLPASLLELELTESALMNNSESVSAALDCIHKLGVSIALDDFGTGYSSLGYLQRFPIDALKVDQSFVSNLPDSRDAASITHAIVAMARSLDMRTVAEGVETQQQLEFLCAAGCNSVQGHLFSRALPAGELEELLRSKKGLWAA